MMCLCFVSVFVYACVCVCDYVYECYGPKGNVPKFKLKETYKKAIDDRKPTWTEPLT